MPSAHLASLHRLGPMMLLAITAERNARSISRSGQWVWAYGLVHETAVGLAPIPYMGGIPCSLYIQRNGPQMPLSKPRRS